VVARSGSDLDVHVEPGGEVVHTLAATTVFGSERALLVLDDRGDWLEVQLPERPNGATGWVTAEDVDELREVPTAIEIDLDARTLTLYEDGEEVLTTEVAVGTDENPTPTGEFYVTDKLLTEDPAGAYGPFAFGLSAWSETLSEFAGGDGQIGIHGTDAPATIGEPVSHGCVRVPNDVAELLNERLHLGTPVTIS
jgi:lipoprotein-anchoring transpeptidase ErfK/SrfK